MILERSMSDDFLTNTFLVAASSGGPGFLIDAGGPMEPLFAAAERESIEVTHLLLTHHHHDHIRAQDEVEAKYPGIVVLGHPDEDMTCEPFAPLEIGGLAIDAVHTPGHTAGMLNFTVPGHIFTGDTLFKNSVGGVRAPGSTNFGDIKSSIMDKLMTLDPATQVHPGHTDSTTIGDEWENNKFVRIWRGLDEEGTGPCKAFGEDATLVLLGDDYDGGHKAWVRWPDGKDDIVPGSQVETG